jgi:hypothetical protein
MKTSIDFNASAWASAVIAACDGQPGLDFALNLDEAQAVDVITELKRLGWKTCRSPRGSNLYVLEPAEQMSAV